MYYYDYYNKNLHSFIYPFTYLDVFTFFVSLLFNKFVTFNYTSNLYTFLILSLVNTNKWCYIYFPYIINCIFI